MNNSIHLNVLQKLYFNANHDNGSVVIAPEGEVTFNGDYTEAVLSLIRFIKNSPESPLYVFDKITLELCEDEVKVSFNGDAPASFKKLQRLIKLVQRVAAFT